jgi:hypothetical protein
LAGSAATRPSRTASRSSSSATTCARAPRSTRSRSRSWRCASASPHSHRYRDAIFGSIVTLLAALVAGTAAPQPARTLIAVGDIASCKSTADEATGQFVAKLPGTVATLGDIAYERGTAAEFNQCYDPVWGTFENRTRPAPGNHEYATAGAAAYFAYFGLRAGPSGRGYYSYELGGWHIIVLNSNCDLVGGCGAGSPQDTWLRADLRKNRTKCTLAYWHHPRFSSGLHGNDPNLITLWQALYVNGAEIVLSGHDHDYERFKPQTPDGVLDRAHGIQEFVVGTGGKSLFPFAVPAANSAIRDDTTYGVLRLKLFLGRWSFRFLPVVGTFTDSGTGTCH